MYEYHQQSIIKKHQKGYINILSYYTHILQLLHMLFISYFKYEDESFIHHFGARLSTTLGIKKIPGSIYCVERYENSKRKKTHGALLWKICFLSRWKNILEKKRAIQVINTTTQTHILHNADIHCNNRTHLLLVSIYYWLVSFHHQNWTCI